MMNFSLSSLVITLMLVTILVYFVEFQLKIEKLAVYLKYDYLILICIFIYLRLFLPFEWKWTITIPSQNIMPAIHKLFNTNVPLVNGTLGFVFLFIWISVFLVKMFFLCKETISLHRTLNGSTNFFMEKETNSFPFIDDKLKRRIFYSKKVESPKLVNLLKPFILIPNIDYSENELHYILLHETQHLKNRDLLITMLVELLTCFYWWFPPIYVLKKQIIFLIELRVDYQITKNLTELEKLDYMQTLVTVKKKANNIVKRDYYTLSIENNFYQKKKSFLSKRIDIFFKKKKQNRLISLLPVIFFLLLIPFFIFEPYRTDHITEETTFSLNKNDENYILKSENGDYYLYVNNKKVGKINNLNAEILDKIQVRKEKKQK